eukprot:CAMPEP_0174256136 /NCGR_PEP_ID=MMETSP0439-20130205/5389_1 /TAXON_ID=0 /ORGANISM="Stereomyxa ramosa, Strain Chinc5" /LENGTH=247 /DNA_ID=CAMNT_0015338605 /DNA_START=84 /DNA_END=827 /DNA_ORIENTATION=-
MQRAFYPQSRLFRSSSSLYFKNSSSSLFATEEKEREVEIVRETNDVGELEKLCQKGITYAQYKLAAMYSTGDGVLRDLQRAAQLYTEAHNKGDVNSTFCLGLMHYKGDHFPKSEKKAVSFWLQASNNGHVEATHNLAHVLAQPTGEVEQDLPTAVKLWEGAGDVGYPPSKLNFAVYTVAETLNSTVGLVMKPEKAFEFITDLVHLNNYEVDKVAEVHALMHFHGIGTKKDRAKAEEILSQLKSGNIK